MQQTLDIILRRLDELGAAIAKLPQRRGRPATKSVDPERKAKQAAYMRQYQAARRAKLKAAKANGAETVAHHQV